MTKSIRRLRMTQQLAREASYELFLQLMKIDPDSVRAADITDEEAIKWEDSTRWPTPAKEMRQFTDAVHKVLTAISKDIDPPASAIRQVEAALNRKGSRVVYDRQASKRNVWDRRDKLRTPDEIKDPANPWQVNLDPVRKAAEILLRYLQLIVECGPVHTVCRLETCHRIVFGQRKTKSFCCDRHREEFWTYDRVKQTYGSDYPTTSRKQREIHRRKKEREEAERKAKTKLTAKKRPAKVREHQ